MDEKIPAKKSLASNGRKKEEFVVENVVFEKKADGSKKVSDYKPLEQEKQPLVDATNSLKEKVDDDEPPKKKVTFDVVETENESEKPKKKVSRIPRESSVEVIDAEEDCKKWEEQCKQQ